MKQLRGIWSRRPKPEPAVRDDPGTAQLLTDLQRTVAHGVASMHLATEELKELLDRNLGSMQRGELESASSEEIELLRRKLTDLHRYLSAVVQYQAERDGVMAEWLQGALSHGRGVVRDEATRVIEDLRDELSRKARDAEGRFLAHVDDRSRSLAYTLSVQEARIRLAMAEGQRGQTDAIKEQLHTLDSIEADLTNALDERLARLAELTGATAAWAVDEVTERAGDRSAAAIQTGVIDLLSVMDRRFAWLEELVEERLRGIERALRNEGRVIVDVTSDEPVISLGGSDPNRRPETAPAAERFQPASTTEGVRA